VSLKVLEFPIIRDLTEIALWPASCTCHRQHPELFSSSFPAAFLKDVDKFTNAKVNFLSILLQRQEPGAAYSDRLSLSHCLVASLSLEGPRTLKPPDFSLTPAFPGRQDARLSSFCIIALVIVTVDMLGILLALSLSHPSHPLSFTPS